MNNPLSWRDGQPYSLEYGDIYFSRESGIDETRHVFLEQNRLAQRWQALQPGEQFVIGETGFGTGLNFLCAWQLWMQVAPASAKLHFVSTELHPLQPDELRESLSLWPELVEYATQLSSQYATLTPGWHQMSFAGGQVTLTLIVGDVNETLPRLHAKVDAWFLDGFAPARNPEIWSDGVFQSMARCSASRATFATFTSAGIVRRGVEAAGFKVDKVRGHGNKREMLRGEYVADVAVTPQNNLREAIVIGAGLAGSATAYSLARRGWKITLIERHPEIASEASGNHQGILYARISPKKNLLSDFALMGYQHTLRAIPGLMPEGDDTWRQCGLLQLAFDADEARRLSGILELALPVDLLNGVDQIEAGVLAGVQLPFDGIHFPGGGWVNPPALCRALSGRPDIMIKTGLEVTELLHDGKIWEARSNGNVLASAPFVIVACAAHTRRFAQTAHLPLRSIRGQVTHLPGTKGSMSLKKVLCSEGYAAPMRQGIHTIGATYGNLEETVELRNVDHAENLAMLAQLSPELYESLGGDGLQLDELGGRAACRCNVPDYLPLVGLVTPEMPGMHVNTGHGSRGLITAMLAAEILASELEGEPAPVPAELIRAMSPGRFLKKPKR